MTPNDTLWTCIARCKECKEELNRATNVPEEDKSKVESSAPFVAICKIKSHNSLPDVNYGVILEWIKETPEVENNGTK